MEDAKDLEALVVDLIKRDNVNIPPYPAVAMRLQRLMAGGDYGIADLQRVIEGDPIMAATILRYANSAAFRGVTATSTLEAAITRIGAKEVSKIALATTIGASAIVSGCLSQLRRRSWRLAMTSALLCRALSRWRRQDPEEAFICGLLHDFGRVVATACFEEVITRTRDLRVMTEAAWAEAVDRFHVELGLVTAARWNLPPLICAVIMAHHVPESDPINKTMIEIVNAGDAVAALLDQAPNLTAPDLAAIGLRPDETESLLAEVGTIATAVASIDETTPGKDTGIFRISSRVLAPTSALAEPRKEGRFPMRVLRATGDASYETTHFARDGVGFTGASMLRENSMIRMRIEAPKGPLEVLGVVSLCVSEGNARRMEAKLFAAEPALLKLWLDFHASLP